MSYRKDKPAPIDRKNIRQITGSFSRLEHRFVTGRFIDTMDTNDEILFYFFLVAVGDATGVSFYSSERMVSLLHIGVASITKARDRLVDKEFIAYRDGVYQVLNLPSMIGEERRKYASGTMGRNTATLFR